MEGGLAKPQQILLALPSPLGRLEYLEAGHVIQPIEHTQIDYIRTTEVQHRLSEPGDSQLS